MWRSWAWAGRAGHFHLQSIVQLPHMVQLSWVVDIDEKKPSALQTGVPLVHRAG